MPGISLEQKVKEQLAEAMKAQNRVAVRALRDIHTNLLRKKDMLRVSSLSEVDEMRTLLSVIRENRDVHEKLKSMGLYGSEDVMKFEEEALEIMERFLPEQISVEELHTKLKEIIIQVGATSIIDMPKVINEAHNQLTGKADLALINRTIRQMLADM